MYGFKCSSNRSPATLERRLAVMLKYLPSWYEESMLDCCRPLDLVKIDGITLQEFACLARCNGLAVRKSLAENIEKEEFINDLKASCSSEESMMVISFSRSTLGQTGDGHFSPIGGYLKK
jgi:glutathione gamma-glutamylcysteinyltransferase